MIQILLKGNKVEDVLDSFLSEFTKMLLCGMSENIENNTELFTEALDYITDELEYRYNDNFIGIGSERENLNLQEYASGIAWSVFGRNTFYSNFGNFGATMKDVAENLLKEFPNLEISGEIFINTDYSNTEEIIKTVDGRIESLYVDE